MNDVHNECIKSHNDMIESMNELLKTMQFLGEMLRQREQAANLSTHTPEPLRRRAIRLTRGAANSSVEDLVPIPSESEDTSESDSDCDLSLCDDFSPINVYEEKSVTFSNPLFDSNDDFTSSDDESLSDEDVPEENVKIYSNPLLEFDDEYISSNVNPLFDEVLGDIENKDPYVSNLDELALLVTLHVYIDVDSSLPLSSRSEDTIFDPDISAVHFYSLEPVASHRSGTFMCFNVYPNILDESPMEIYSSTCFVPNITMIWEESS
ncbi:hypothetical protein Tco_0907755 [Tanacetum coccineum]|uniref:Uncharacterized protein n=1 Tax=Tanacetum coccineum TaxID=301880 RepID=A0ABQ5CK73_9ASTR